MHLLHQPSRVGPADRLRTSRCLRVWTVCEMAGPVRTNGFIFLFAACDCCGSPQSLSCLDDARRSSSVLCRSSRALIFSWPAGFNCFFFASSSSRHWAPSREPSNKLGLKKQRVVDVVTDAWQATAGLRGGQVLEARALTCTASHNLSNSASAGPRGPVPRVDLAAEDRKSLFVPLLGIASKLSVFLFSRFTFQGTGLPQSLSSSDDGAARRRMFTRAALLVNRSKDLIEETDR